MIKKILIADDEPNIVAAIEFLLQKSGYEVHVARDGEDALRLIEACIPDLVLLDVMMPEYDGFYGLSNIKKINPAAKVIMVTADLTYDTEKKLKEFNASAVIYKPYEIDSVIETIHKVNNGIVTISQ